jgi:hypothetical protein
MLMLSSSSDDAGHAPGKLDGSQGGSFTASPSIHDSNQRKSLNADTRDPKQCADDSEYSESLIYTRFETGACTAD